ncbi:MAG: DEAD/DEAH box helicase [Legionellaceae bacterium]|nr:DEAD/DEAH box helicase [Legionellaceae bacterium]
MLFKDLGLSEPILRAVLEQNYSTPTPIQVQAIPNVLSGKDLLASAQTGTGKTAGFSLPLLHRLSTMPVSGSNQISILILAPTRELASQIHDSVCLYGKYLPKLRTAAVFGGVKINPQMMKLRGGLDILVATPGRLLDLYQQRAVRFDNVKTLVLDEADRMLDMGFINDIKRIMSKLPKVKQTLLFSATFSKEICHLAKEFLDKPVEISVAPRNEAAASVNQKVHPVDKARKADLLSHLIRNENWDQALVFARTKHGANKLVKLLAVDGIDALAIHGNKSQSQRTKALNDFKNGKVHILVATDIAARGIDIDDLPSVVNFDLPQVAEDYVHRIGRTGRAGASGCAVSLVCADEVGQLQEIERLIKRKIERIEVEDFEPKHNLPVNPVAKKPIQRRSNNNSSSYNGKNRQFQSRKSSGKSTRRA